MKLMKYYNRDRFTEDEKQKIARKSNDCCCHCGRKVFFGYGATVDHFIPLDKGGSNSMYNLIMLCHECNQEKDNKIQSMEYIPYLSDKYFKELNEYVNSYIQVMDYCQRNRLFAYDEYKIPVSVCSNDYSKHSKKQIMVSSCKLKLATWNDLDRLHEYFVKYLKKYNQLDDEFAARENIIFWMQFGCIYYIEQVGEINTIIAITIKHLDKDGDFRGIDYIPQFYIFPYYATDKTISLIKNIVISLPSLLIKERNLSFIPVSILMLECDKVFPRVASCFNKIQDTDISDFKAIGVVIGEIEDLNNDHLEISEMNEEEKKVYEFLHKFDNVTNEMIKYFKKYSDRESISWMIQTVLSYEFIKDTELEKFMNYLEE